MGPLKRTLLCLLTGLPVLAADANPSEYVPLVEPPAELARPLRSPSSQQWKVERGASLKETLRAWARRAGWQEPLFDGALARDDKLLQASATFTGDFRDAVHQMMAALPPDLKIRAHIYSENLFIRVEIEELP